MIACVLKFKPNSHDKVFDILIKNGDFYNDDIELVSSKTDSAKTISTFSEENGFITGIQVFENEFKSDIIEMFKPITQSIN